MAGEGLGRGTSDISLDQQMNHLNVPALDKSGLSVNSHHTKAYQRDVGAKLRERVDNRKRGREDFRKWYLGE